MTIVLHYNGLWAQLRLVAPNISWLFMMTPISQNLTRACCLLLPAWIRNGDAVGKHHQLIISRVQFLFRSIFLIIKIVSSTFKDVRRGVGKILGNLMPQKWSGFVRGSAARSLHNTPLIIWRDCHRGAARKEPHHSHKTAAAIAVSKQTERRSVCSVHCCRPQKVLRMECRIAGCWWRLHPLLVARFISPNVLTKRNQAFVFEHFTLESSTLISSFGVDIAGAAGVELLCCVTMGKVRELVLLRANVTQCPVSAWLRSTGTSYCAIALSCVAVYWQLWAICRYESSSCQRKNSPWW